MTSAPKKRVTYINLDFVRGFSALMVLFSHARAFVVVSPSAMENPGILAKGFYFLTGFGHQAVLVFFVLSGFFISRSILNLLARGQWTWRRYLISRMSRLWAVLLPGLFLTAFWDHFGMFLGGVDYYQGLFFQQYASGPGLDGVGVDMTASNFVYNALFLVGISTPNTFGTNGPLWSLTYEFWYYMVFPLAYLLFPAQFGRPLKYFSFALLLFLFWLLPSNVLFLGIVWLFGYAVLLLSRSARVKRVCSGWPYFLFSFLVFTTVAFATRVDAIENVMIGDIVVGFGFSLFMLALIFHRFDSAIFSAISRFTSKISYSLYVVHFSFLAFIATVGLNNQQSQFGFGSVGLFVGLCVLSVLYASVVYWLFERNTPKIASFLRSKFNV